MNEKNLSQRNFSFHTLTQENVVIYYWSVVLTIWKAYKMKIVKLYKIVLFFTFKQEQKWEETVILLIHAMYK